VPAAGRTIASVRQNLPLLIDHGTAASALGCLSCWGATLAGVSDPARSALGIQADGHLVWAAAEHATIGELADALLSAGVVRAVELDINPEWVAGYLYGHRGGAGPAPVPVVPGQNGIPGQYLAPWSRDLFTIVAS
ncbi:MAG TPA: phosphodiester glycosidase family protein, partial [Solirubrobacteraceae bacterium]|nr:phosphodiester glycosidase family protein [Solirubrobacteraceae bacterium]